MSEPVPDAVEVDALISYEEEFDLRIAQALQRIVGGTSQNPKANEIGTSIRTEEMYKLANDIQYGYDYSISNALSTKIARIVQKLQGVT